MRKSNSQKMIEGLLAHADIKINGNRPWDMQVHQPALFERVIGQGSLGLGEAYMEGWWDCHAMDELFARILNAELPSHVVTLRDRLFFLVTHLSNRQTGKRSYKVGEQHYDAGNDLYQRMLDQDMNYSCGYWRDAATLDEAQQHKLELVARKLKLEPGMRVLDVGCGWGGAAHYMAKQHGVRVVGVTISREQAQLAADQCMGQDVQIRFQDYRELDEPFDRIYSIGMFEHVGFKNYPDFFRVMDRCLSSGGLFLLHSIGHRITSRRVDPWIERYIFPNSILPSSELIGRHSSEFFAIEDWQNFGLDYYKTLMIWHRNIDKAWPQIPQYDEEFRRMWRYYLMTCAGAFKAYRNHLWQIVFSKGPQTDVYEAVRSGK
ncbi:MAG: cyclopropane fatty acyl phospholipid synthase [Gammaproteobacteria bacterium]|nr:cyclopropane fatty acyl phospholipid synthase [Gammaproteobacteria bacterium]